MMIDLTPSMTTALAVIGNRSITASEIGANGGVLKRLWELGFLVMDYEKDGYLPPYYSLSERGHGAAAILTSKPVPVDCEAPIARIKRIVAQHYKIPIIEMVSARRSKAVARPRQVAMYMAKKLTPKSLPDIGRHFGNRDHTTVIHAVRRIEQIMADDHDFKDMVRALMGEVVSTANPSSAEIASFGPDPVSA